MGKQLTKGFALGCGWLIMVLPMACTDSFQLTADTTIIAISEAFDLFVEG